MTWRSDGRKTWHMANGSTLYFDCEVSAAQVFQRVGHFLSRVEESLAERSRAMRVEGSSSCPPGRARSLVASLNAAGLTTLVTPSPWVSPHEVCALVLDWPSLSHKLWKLHLGVLTGLPWWQELWPGV